MLWLFSKLPRLWWQVVKRGEAGGLRGVAIEQIVPRNVAGGGRR
jgi:hypothetical protein